MYTLLRPLLFLQDSEAIHERTGKFGYMAGKSAIVRGVSKQLYSYEHSSLEQTVFGLRFKNPLGTAAGFDKPGRLINILGAAGIGFVEAGTVTPKPQVGNPKPRLFRLEKDQAVINRMGFNNAGLEVFANMLEQRSSTVLVGGNIGKNKDTTQAVDDYTTCFKKLFDLVDYFAVNVSSPNTPGLRNLQDKEPLTALLSALQQLNKQRAERKPILLKIAPDLTPGQLDDIVEVAKVTKIDGIIATNTTIARDGLQVDPEVIESIGNGGLSGQPLTRAATEVVRHLYAASEGAIPIVGVGGISSAEQAYEKIKAGASLVQAYTGFIYQGPAMIKSINRGLVQLLQRDGYSSISQAVGADHR